MREDSIEQNHAEWSRVTPVMGWLLPRLLFLLLTAWMSPPAAGDPKTLVRAIPLGKSRLEVLERDFGSAPWVVCNVHDDENSSVEAALQVLPEFQGRLVELKHSGERNLRFQIGTETFVCDPNRIFTASGIEATLKELSQWNEAAAGAVQALAETLLGLCRFEEAQIVIALHNNSEDRYSVRSYLPSAEYARDAAKVHVADGQDPDDFFFVTDSRLFEALKAEDFNVVLQDNELALDDGSLSVYCGRKGLLYVNVEAQHEHVEEQTRMLRELFGVLRRDLKGWMPSTPPNQGTSQAPLTMKSPKDVQLVNLKELDPTLVIDARYATTDNIVKEAMYPANALYLEKSAAERLVRVQRALQTKGLGLKVLDAFRPLAVQWKLWEKMPDSRYVADPRRGSRHNRAAAVDVTLVGPDGQELLMPTKFDEFTPKAHRDATDLPAEAIRNREILEEAMVAEGFLPLPTEWWHFDAPGWQQYPLLDVNPYARSESEAGEEVTSDAASIPPQVPDEPRKE